MAKRSQHEGSRFRAALDTVKVCALQLIDVGSIPNSKLPLLLFKGAFRMEAENLGSAMEEVFASNGWGAAWRNGIYPYHHYHSTAHEVLGVYAGSGTVQFGGEDGESQLLEMGDVVVIPAGVAHKNLGSSSDFGVVGAYPEGQQWDMCYGNPGERPAADQRLARVPLPNADPVFGVEGPLLEHWKL